MKKGLVILLFVFVIGVFMIAIAIGLNVCQGNYVGEAINCHYLCYAVDETNADDVAFCEGRITWQCSDSDRCIWLDRCDENEMGTRSCSGLSQSECENSFFKNICDEACYESLNQYNRKGENEKYYGCKWGGTYCRIWIPDGEGDYTLGDSCTFPCASDSDLTCQLDSDCAGKTRWEQTCEGPPGILIGSVKVDREYQLNCNLLTNCCDIKGDLIQTLRDCSTICPDACTDGDVKNDIFRGCAGPKSIFTTFFCSTPSRVPPPDFTCQWVEGEFQRCDKERCNAECDKDDDCDNDLFIRWRDDGCVKDIPGEDSRSGKTQLTEILNNGECDLDDTCACGEKEGDKERKCIKIDDCGAQCEKDSDCDPGFLCDTLNTCKCQNCYNADINNLRASCEQEGDYEDANEYVDSSSCSNRGSVSCIADEEYVGLNNVRDGFGNINLGDSVTINVELSGKVDIPGGVMPADIMYVLDKSGSMDLDYEEKKKIEWAKDALNDVYKYFKDTSSGRSFKAGLVTFNHDNQVNAFLDYTENTNFGFTDFDACGCTWIAGGIQDSVFEKNLGSSLSCADGSVKRVMVLASDGDEDRDKDADWSFLDDIKDKVPSDVAFYTIGVGSSDVEREKLEKVAYEFGNGEGAYYGIDNIGDLYSVYEKIANPFSSSKTADEIIVRVVLNDNFEYVSSTLNPEFVSTDETIAEWRINGISKDEVKEFNIVTKLKDSADVTGQVGIINLDESFVKVFNKCGLEEKDLSQILIGIGDAPIVSSVYWADNDTEMEINSAEVGDTVKMILENGNLGESLNFEIYEDDILSDDNIRVGEDAIEGAISSGNIVGIWRITQEDYNNGDGLFEGDIEFYFKIQGLESSNLIVSEGAEPPVEGSWSCVDEGSKWEKGVGEVVYTIDTEEGEGSCRGSDLTPEAEGTCCPTGWTCQDVESDEHEFPVCVESEIFEPYCDADLNSATWIDKDEEFDTTKIMGYCSGEDGYVGTSDDCCPTGIGWVCRGDYEEEKCIQLPSDRWRFCQDEEIYSCSDYNKVDYEDYDYLSDAESACVLDDGDFCYVGNFLTRSSESFPGECVPEEGINADLISYKDSESGCAWDDDVGSCYQSRNISFEYNGQSFSAVCNNKFNVIQGCDDGQHTMVVNISSVFQEWRPLLDYLEDDNLLIVDLGKSLSLEDCQDSICKTKQYELACLGPIIQLPVFGFINFILVFFILTIYFVLRRN